jgi:hypothetical protein
LDVRRFLMSDLVYLAIGAGALLLFALYAHSLARL